MPVVTLSATAINRIAGTDLDATTLGDRMPMMGGDLDAVEGDKIIMEWFPDRPDLLTEEGTGRAVRAFLGSEPGLPTYTVAPAKTQLTIDPSVQAIRPFAGLCFVRNVSIDDGYVQTLMQAQEKITMAPGRKRRKIAVGLHDASGVEGPFTYQIVGPDELRFVPLQSDEAMTPGEVLVKHPKGRLYAHLVPADQIPAFLDAKGQVLSLPPIINGAHTTVTATTKDILIDVTGTEEAAVRRTLALLATSLAERGGTIEAIEVQDRKSIRSCPDLTPEEWVVDVEKAQRWLGLPLDGDGIAAALARMGHGAESFGNRVLVHVPAWRFDILHEVDLLEDIAIGYGFENFRGYLPTLPTLGGDLDHQDVEDRTRDALIGQGHLEVRTLLLTNMSDAYEKWGMEPQPATHVEVENPVLLEQTHLRRLLTPSLLQIHQRNRHRPLPQTIFEVGQVVENVGGTWRNQHRVAVTTTGSRVSFTSIQEILAGLMRDLGVAYQLEPYVMPGCIPGRAATVLVAGKPIGNLGELHPDTTLAFDLVAATAFLELDLLGLR